MSKLRILLIILCFVSQKSFALDFNIQSVDAIDIETWIYEEHSLPIISGVMSFNNGGYAFDPDGKGGLANILSLILEDIVSAISVENPEISLAKIDFKINEDFLFIEFKTSTDILDVTLAAISRSIKESLSYDKNLKKQVNKSLSKMNEFNNSPYNIANRSILNSIFAGHPYSNDVFGTTDSLYKISSSDIIGFANRIFSKNNIKVSLVGDINKKTANKLLKKHFDFLTDDSTNKIELPKFDLYEFPDIESNKIDRNISQTKIHFALPLIEMSALSEDYHTMIVLNYIIGGHTDSVLFKDLRAKNGLAYYVTTYLKDLGNIYLWMGEIATKAEQASTVPTKIRKIINRVASNGVNEQDFNIAKSSIANAMDIRLSSNAGVAKFLNFAQLKGLGINYINEYRDNINAVSINKVNKLLKQQSKKIMFVEVGKVNT